MTLNEDYTAGVLAGVPIFLVNRSYVELEVAEVFFRQKFYITLHNNLTVSIIEFTDWSNSGGHQYEMLANMPGGYVGGDFSDVRRGDAMEMHKLLCELETLSNT